MSDAEHMAALLADVEEEFATTGFLGLYGFTWALRGLRLGLSEEAVTSTAREAYEVFRSRTPTVLVWLTWPPRLDDAVLAAEDVALEFDIDYAGQVGKPFLALIPASA